MDNTDQTLKLRRIERPLKNALSIMLIAIPLIAIAPIIFTSKSGIIDFTNTGTIGDTIGGITAPFIGILGSILVFLALRAQVQANILVQLQIIEQEREKKLDNDSAQLNKLYENLRGSIDNFSFTTLDPWEFANYDGRELKGSEAFHQLFQVFYCDSHLSESDLKTNPKITEVISILEICDSLLDKIENSEVRDKNVLYTLTLHQFVYRIFPRLSNDYPNNLEIHYCDNCNKNHGFPSRISSLVKSIKSKCKSDIC